MNDKKLTTNSKVGIILIAIMDIAMLVLSIYTDDKTIPIMIFITITFLLLALINGAMEQVGKTPFYKGFFGFFLLSLMVTFTFGIYKAFSNSIIYYKDGIKTEAEIYKIDVNEDYDYETDEDGNSYRVDKSTCDNYFHYEVEHTIYDGKTSNAACSYHVGDKVKIYYLENDPSKYESINPIIYIIIGILLVVCWIFIPPLAIQIILCKEVKIFKKINKHYN